MKQNDDKEIGALRLTRLTAIVVITATAIILPTLLIILWKLGATPFQLFSTPIILAMFGISVWMAVHWREWRAIPLSIVPGVVVIRTGLLLAVESRYIDDTPSIELLQEMILWAIVPLGFASIAYLWRIFENQARFKNAQEALELSEKNHRHLIEQATDAFYVADADGVLTLLNTGCARIFGRRAADLTGTCLFDLIPEETAEDIRTALDRHVKDETFSFYHEFPITGRNGKITWVGENLQAVTERGVLSGFQAVMRDITEQRHAEEALQKSENRLLTLFETMSEGIIQIDPDGKIMFSNQAAETLLDASSEELNDRTYSDRAWKFLRPDGSAMPVREWAGYIAHKTQSPAHNTVAGIQHSNNDVHWLRINALPIRGNDQQTNGVVVTFADITETKAAEENIRIVEFALDNTDEHVFMLNQNGKIVYANKRAISSLGYSPEEILSKTIHDIDPQLSTEDWNETWRAAKAGEWPTSESIHVRKDGESFPTITSSNYFEFNDQGYIFAFVRDISRETDLASQLRQSQKIEAIGMLAGGIAHDFNNILSAIIGYTELAVGEAKPQSSQATFLSEVKRAANRAADLVGQILTFSRSKEEKRHPLILEPVVKEALKLLRSSLPSTIELRQDIQTGTNPVMSDPIQIHQVLMNLCTNAYHAMKDKGGVLEVDLHEVEINAEDAINYLNITPGTFIRLSVRDTGTGMDEKTRLRIFEPFFTTKPEGEGTGLGLATVLGIVQGHKGAIRVESTPGEGTHVTVVLPICMKTKAQPEKVNEAKPEKGSERVLFIDDEHPIADSTGIALEQLGYEPHICYSGDEALEYLRLNPGETDILITDYTMPGITGIDLARKVHEASPEIPIILCTGLGSEVGDIEGSGISEILKKPLTVGILTRKMRSLLDT